MHSLRGWNRLFVVGGVISCVAGALVPSPTITPPPQLYVGDLELRAIAARQGPDAVSMIEMLLTALPASLREIAATNVPAVSSILWGEFLDNNKPEWFTKLPQDIQNYLIRQFGPSTAWPTTTPSSSSSSSSSTSQSSNSTSSSFVASSTLSSATTTPSMSAKGEKDDTSGLTRRQKMGIGIGVGVPLGLLVIGALVFGCCFLCRRRRRRHIEGSEPPSSPGFIPRFSFQDKHHASEHHAPLNARHYSSQSTNWDDDTGYNAAEWGSMQREGHREDYRDGNHYPAGTAMAMHDSSPVMAPAVFHTHSSNRARGTRTSYTSLRSVAEVTEPDDNITEPAFSDGKGTPPPHTQSMRRLSQPLHMDVPVMLAAAPVKRKPVSMGSVNSPAAEAASRSLRRPALAKTHHRSSSSSNAVMSNSSSSSGLGSRTENTSPMSPVSDVAPKDVAPKNPFTDDYDYLEDYGPEYSHNGYSQNGYADLEDGLYGGYKSLDRYPNLSHSRKSSKTEWPLKNVVESTNKRTKSPLWDRVYN